MKQLIKINKNIFKIRIFMIAILIVIIASNAFMGCGKENVQGEQGIKSKSAEIFAMDTYMTVTAYGNQCDEAVEDALEEIKRLDELLSVGNDESEISVINNLGRGALSEDSIEMLDCAFSVNERSGGAFDISIYPVMELWGFTTGQFNVPEETTLMTMVQAIDSSQIVFDKENKQIELAPNQGIDLGGIAKGYTSDRIIEIFKGYDLISGMVSLGGNVEVYKTKPDGSDFKCGIIDPNNSEEESELMGIIEISDKAVITSGAYERFFYDEKTGKKYHHIIDPKTGYPVENEIISSTIVSENGMLADTLSTTCYVMGLKKSIEYWKNYGEDFDFIIMTDDNEIYLTEGLENSFASDYHINVIHKE